LPVTARAKTAAPMVVVHSEEVRTRNRHPDGLIDAAAVARAAAARLMFDSAVALAPASHNARYNRESLLYGPTPSRAAPHCKSGKCMNGSVFEGITPVGRGRYDNCLCRRLLGCDMVVSRLARLVFRGGS
jgi:hypothetical protein